MSEKDRDEQAPSATNLLHMVSDGRRTAMGLLIDLYDPLILAAVKKYLGFKRFRVEGEDLLQTIRLALVKGLPKLRKRNSKILAAWLRKVVHNQLIDWENRRRNAGMRPVGNSVDPHGPVISEIPAEGPTPSREFEIEETLERLRQAIESVPPRYRDVLRFIFDKGPTPAEVADFLGKGPDAARKFTARAMNQWKRALNSKGQSIMNSSDGQTGR